MARAKTEVLGGSYIIQCLPSPKCFLLLSLLLELKIAFVRKPVFRRVVDTFLGTIQSQPKFNYINFYWLIGIRH